MNRSGLLAMITLSAAITRGVAEEVGTDFFEARVRPVLVAKCLDCHGEEQPEGGLRLTSRASLLKGGLGGPVVVEGQPERSRLITAIRREGLVQMPPDGTLDSAEIEALSHWVALGFPWPQTTAHEPAQDRQSRVSAADRQHWAFQPVADPPAPAVQLTEWPRTSVDRFILAKLENAGLQPAPPADRHTLLRRATYDLTGLPPPPQEVEAFLNDPRPTPDVFLETVDRLLASPRYGERWGRHWLDVARYADTKDGVLMYGDDRVWPYAYTYRDYVIRAFNEDLPFDRFVHEQLAADLLEPPVDPWRLAALGFLTLGRQFDSNIHDVIDDQIDTVTRGFLGVTVACARCHDHKYDPIPTADYYSLYGVFASCETPLELPLIERPENVPGGAEFEQAASAKREELRKFLDEQYELLSETARQRSGDYLIHVATRPPDPMETAIYFLSLAPNDLRLPIVARWRQLIEERSQPDDPVFGLWHDLMQLEDSTESESGKVFPVRAAEILAQWAVRPAGTERGSLNPRVLAALQPASLQSRVDVARTYAGLLNGVYAEFKSSANGDAAGAPSRNAARDQLLELVVGPGSPAHFTRNQTRNFMSRQPKDAFGGKINELDRMAVQSPHAPPRAMVLRDAEELYRPRVFVRGNPSRPGEPVPRRSLEVLCAGERSPFPRGSGRLDLAQSIASCDNPLTARVIVNRVWMHHFGEPLVGTPSDFGRRSSSPTHPELLDHLATRFVREGWSLKHLHRLLMGSSVYQQASAAPIRTCCGCDGRGPGESIALADAIASVWISSRCATHCSTVSGRLEHRSGGRPADVANDPQSRCRTVYGLVDRQSLAGGVPRIRFRGA